MAIWYDTRSWPSALRAEAALASINPNIEVESRSEEGGAAFKLLQPEIQSSKSEIRKARQDESACPHCLKREAKVVFGLLAAFGSSEFGFSDSAVVLWLKG